MPVRDAVTPPTPAPVAVPVTERGWLRWALEANLIFQILIIVTGGLVRLTGSGLGCPTWPQCVPGSFIPTAKQAEGFHSAIEFGNRLMTFVLAAVAIAVVVGARRFAGHQRRFVLLCWVPLLGIVAQAVLGGIIVLARLDPKTVSPHFLLSIALVAYSTWLLHYYDTGGAPRALGIHPLARALAMAAAAVGAIVIVVGTAVTGSGPHSGDDQEPIRFGFDPVATSWLHADAAMIFTGLVAGVFVVSRVTPASRPFRLWWTWTLILCLVQGAIGYTQYFSGLPIAMVTTHLLGSALLTTTLTLGVLTAWE